MMVITIMNEGGYLGGAAQPIDWYHHDSKPYRLVFAGVSRMATVYKHHEVNIVALAACRPGDIAIVAAADGWWLRFVGADGHVDSYDAPHPSYLEALWAAKAAAEFGLD